MTRSSGVKSAFPRGIGAAARLKAEKAAAAKKQKQHVPKQGRSAKRGKNQEADDGAALKKAYEQLFALVGQKYASTAWRATDVCELAWHLKECGLTALQKLAYNPHGEFFSKNASRVCRRVFGMDAIEDKQIHVQVPIVDVTTSARVFYDAPTLSLGDLLAEELAENPQAVFDEIDSLDTENWRSNSVRRAAEENGDVCVCYGIFVDAAAWKGKGPRPVCLYCSHNVLVDVAFVWLVSLLNVSGAGTRESILVYYITVFSRQNRRTIFTMRKEWMCGDVCGCSCRGRCTVNAFERHFAWQATSAASGLRPAADYRNLPFAVGSSLRNQANTPYFQWKGKTVRFALIEMRADLGEISEGMGMPKTNQKRPCWFCPCKLQDLYAAEIPPPRTHEQYLTEISMSRTCVTVNKHELELIVAVLVMDRRVESVWGRCIGSTLQVRDAISGLFVKLQKFDRIEMADDCWDIHCTRSHFVGRGPWKLQFWRYTDETCFSFFPHFFGVPGFVLEYIMVGKLHTLDLGITPVIEGETLLRFLQHGGVFKNDTTKAGLTDGCRRLTKALRAWYSNTKVPNKSLSRLSKISLKTLGYFGSDSNGVLKCKGLEARHALGFVQSLFTPKVLALVDGAQTLKVAVDSLVSAYKMMKSNNRNINSDRLTAHLDSFYTNSALAGVHLIPKFHMCRHMGTVAKRAGNPSFFCESADESHNQIVVAIAQASATQFFDKVILAREQLATNLERGTQQPHV
jgi:hypothetical protein